MPPSDTFSSWLTRTRSALTERGSDLWYAALKPQAAEPLDEELANQARVTAPIIWVLGKVQTGKSSIVQAVTGSTAAEVGTGFRSCTRTARIFDFPPAAPALRFLDTRGLGEASYDPTEDLSVAEAQAHLLLVVMRALDPQQSAVVDVVRHARKRHPDWPVIVAQTCLHDAYEIGDDHVQPYPFDAQRSDDVATAGVPADLARALHYQRELFNDIPGDGSIRFVPIDFTKPDDGFVPVLYGLDALSDALQTTAPAAIAAALAADAVGETSPATRAKPHIVGFSAAAAAADVAPVLGLIAVPAVQGKMLHNIALIYGITWDKRILGEFTAALGTGTVTRMALSFGARELAKLIPAYGQTVGTVAASTMSYATTYALGVAACYFLDQRRDGTSSDSNSAEDIAEVYSKALKEALGIVKSRNTDDSDPETPAGGRA